MRNDISRNLNVIRGRFLDRLAEHLRVLMGVFKALDAGTAKPADVTEVRARSHKISGIAATFGYDGLGDQAARVESLSESWLTSVLTPESTAKLNRNLARLLLLINEAIEGN